MRFILKDWGYIRVLEPNNYFTTVHSQENHE